MVEGVDEGTVEGFDAAEGVEGAGKEHRDFRSGLRHESGMAGVL